MKHYFKFLIAAIIISLSSFNFAQDWYICLGSYQKIENAKALEKDLTEANLDVFISTFTISDTLVLNRVLLNEPFKTLEDSKCRRLQLEKHPAIISLNINGIWTCQSCGPLPKITPIPEVKEPETKKVEPSEPVFVEPPVVFDTPEEKEPQVEPVAEPQINPEQVPEIEEPEIKDEELTEEHELPPEETPEPPAEPVQESVEEPQEELPVEPKEEEPELQEPEINKEPPLVLISDSDTNEPVSGAKLEFSNGIVLYTNEEGTVLLNKDFTDDIYTVTVSKDEEYVTTTSSLMVRDGEIIFGSKISIPPFIDNSRFKIILQWNNKQIDLDAHLKNENRHVFFDHPSDGHLLLKLDAKNGPGPETISLYEIEENSTFEYYVYCFSDAMEQWSTNLSNSEPTVKVFFDNKFITSFQAVKEQKGNLWHVFDIIEGSQIKPVNEFLAADLKNWAYSSDEYYEEDSSKEGTLNDK